MNGCDESFISLPQESHMDISIYLHRSDTLPHTHIADTALSWLLLLICGVGFFCPLAIELLCVELGISAVLAQ